MPNGTSQGSKTASANDPTRSHARNQPRTFDEAEEQLSRYGWTLVQPTNVPHITTNAKVTVKCANGHVKTTTFGNRRGRFCRLCTAPVGERLISALLTHYLPDERTKWVFQWRIPVKERLLFDFANPERMIAIENQSSLHHKDAKWCGGEEGLRRRKARDRRKKKLTKKGRPLEGWRIKPLYFEAAQLAKFAKKDENGSYLPKVIAKFRKFATGVGIELRKEDITPVELRTSLAVAQVPDGFELLSEWHGAGKHHDWRHTACDKSFAMPRHEIVGAQIGGKSGCPWCDKTGRPGEWLKFLGRLNKRGYHFSGTPITASKNIPTQNASVELRCGEHRTTCKNKRSWLNTWLTTDSRPRRLLPPCKACAIREQKSRAEARLPAKGSLALTDRLGSAGFAFVDQDPGPSSIRHNGKITARKQTVRCRACGTVQPMNVPQRLLKLAVNKRGRTTLGCANKDCKNATQKGPQPKSMRPAAAGRV